MSSVSRTQIPPTSLSCSVSIATPAKSSGANLPQNSFPTKARTVTTTSPPPRPPPMASGSIAGSAPLASFATTSMGINYGNAISEKSKWVQASAKAARPSCTTVKSSSSAITPDNPSLRFSTPKTASHSGRLNATKKTHGPRRPSFRTAAKHKSSPPLPTKFAATT